MKQKVRLTENDLHNIIKEAVQQIINEIGDTQKGQYALGKLAQRQDGESLFGGSDTKKYAERYHGNSNTWSPNGDMDGWKMKKSFQNGRNAYTNHLDREEDKNNSYYADKYGYYDKSDFHRGAI